MTDTKFTPGPWSVPSRYPSEVEHSSGDTIASCWHEQAVGKTVDLNGIYPCSLEESAANAHLIAAAPELYEALEQALAVIKDFLEYEHDGDPWTEDARAMGEMDIHEFLADGRFDSARAALAKARGEQ